MKRVLPIVVAAVVVLLLASQSSALFGVRRTFTVELPDANGLRAGDAVQVAGIAVGEVTKVRAAGDRVQAEFRLDNDVPLTADTRTEVKLATLLGTRFLDLTPGKGKKLGGGGTIGLDHAYGAATLERVWLDNGDVLGRFDPAALSRAVDVLSTDLNGSPADNRAALDGLANLADLVAKRDDQLSRLLVASRSVTDEAVAQRGQLTQLMEHGDQVFAMLEQRKAAIDALLRDTRSMVVDLTATARRTHQPMSAALRKLHTILGVLVKHRDDLAETLKVADPALRLYVNSAGDGPWLGVNAPYAIFPDSWWCTFRKDIGC
ncbi:putative Mce family protein [Nocardioides phosphati]|uniref:Mce family protein n=1 Tax=Nocardioides phosphati TaxID=1867775 RepID=A0ABQ2NGK1_9ACTN|nr:MCE family protein [Nocardioides phosphati]GGO93924.1 putative Mce family protein [Nocardioides phosphati]